MFDRAKQMMLRLHRPRWVRQTHLPRDTMPMRNTITVDGPRPMLKKWVGCGHASPNSDYNLWSVAGRSFPSRYPGTGLRLEPPTEHAAIRQASHPPIEGIKSIQENIAFVDVNQKPNHLDILNGSVAGLGLGGTESQPSSLPTTTTLLGFDARLVLTSRHCSIWRPKSTVVGC